MEVLSGNRAVVAGRKLNAPSEFKTVLEEISETTTIKGSPNCKQTYDFVLIFVKTISDIEK